LKQTNFLISDFVDIFNNNLSKFVDLYMLIGDLEANQFSYTLIFSTTISLSFFIFAHPNTLPSYLLTIVFTYFCASISTRIYHCKTMSLYGWMACLPDQCDNKVTTCGLAVVFR